VDPRQLQLALEQLANEPGPVTEPIEMDSGETPVRSHPRRRPTDGGRCRFICRVPHYQSRRKRQTQAMKTLCYPRLPVD
jgi:hypothetical protein